MRISRNEKVTRQKQKGLKLALKTSKSINDFLAKDDITDILQLLERKQLEITDCILLYKTRDGGISYIMTGDILLSNATYMLECTKFDILNDRE